MKKAILLLTAIGLLTLFCGCSAKDTSSASSIVSVNSDVSDMGEESTVSTEAISDAASEPASEAQSIVPSAPASQLVSSKPAEAAAKITINFVADGAEIVAAGGGASPSTFTVDKGGKVKVPFARKEYFTFDGWSKTKENQTRVSLNNGFDNVMNESATYYAIFHPVYYAVSFESAGGEYVSLMSAQHGDTIKLPDCKRTGYVFEGWYTALDGGTLVGKAGDSFTTDQVHKFYAHWSK